jgi:FAD:protein FMN transferase
MSSVFTFEAIGTQWQIDVYQALSSTEERALLEAIRKRIASFDAIYSRFRDDSLVAQIAREKGTFTFPDDAFLMLSLYRDLYERTGGLVTPLVGQMLVDAGYDATYSLVQKKPLQVAPLWEDVMTYRHPLLTTKTPVLLDFGAAGKGYLVDLIAEVIEAHGVTAYCIDAGGDMIHKNTEPIRVGLEHPLDTTKVIGVVTLANESICGSSGNRRTWGNFNHIINPKELSSSSEILAVWVTSASALRADALATCLFFVEPQILTDHHVFEYCIVYKDLSILASPHFPAELFTQEKTTR